MPSCRLTITLTGVRTFSFSPSHIFFGRIEKNKPLAVSKVVEISWPSKRGITISDITTSADFLCWQQINRYVNGGMEISKIKVIADPQKAPIGIFYEKVFVTTSGLFRPVIEIPVRGEIAGNIIVSPRRIFFGLVKKGKTVSRKIKLEIASSEEAQITGINTNSKFLSAKILPQKKSNICEAAVSLDKTHGIGRIDAKVRIETTDAYRPIIEVPVYGLVIE